MLLIPLISPQGWDYVLLLATPAVVCLVDRWRELTRIWQGALALRSVTMCLTIFDIMGRSLYGRFMSLALVSVAALGVAVVSRPHALAHACLIAIVTLCKGVALERADVDFRTKA